MRVPRELLRDTATIEDYRGSGSRGALYNPPRTVRCSYQPTQRLIADAHGLVVNVSTLMIIRPEDGPVRSESLVVGRGTKSRVVQSYAMPDERRPYFYELMLADYTPAEEGPDTDEGVGSGSGS